MRSRTVIISALLFTFLVAGRLSPARAGGGEALLKTRLQEAADSYTSPSAPRPNILQGWSCRSASVRALLPL
jgi:hypothetical protein